MICVCGRSMERREYGWRRLCRCKPTAAYWVALAPIPADGVAFHQLTGLRVPKRGGLYRYGGAGGGG